MVKKVLQHFLLYGCFKLHLLSINWMGVSLVTQHIMNTCQRRLTSLAYHTILYCEASISQNQITRKQFFQNPTIFCNIFYVKCVLPSPLTQMIQYLAEWWLSNFKCYVVSVVMQCLRPCLQVTWSCCKYVLLCSLI